MTDAPTPPPSPPGTGPGPDTIASIGSAMARMRLMIGRRFIGNLVISRVGGGMELSHLDVVGTVRRLQATQEATVGAIAEELRVDPSRSSRIVADLVRQGLLKREASQEDARRTIVVITPVGQDLLKKGGRGEAGHDPRDRGGLARGGRRALRRTL